MSLLKCALIITLLSNEFYSVVLLIKCSIGFCKVRTIVACNGPCRTLFHGICVGIHENIEQLLANENSGWEITVWIKIRFLNQRWIDIIIVTQSTTELIGFENGSLDKTIKHYLIDMNIVNQNINIDETIKDDTEIQDSFTRSRLKSCENILTVT